MVVCVEAGLTVDAAMQRVGQELILAHPALSRELGIAHMETRVGLSRPEALKNLGVARKDVVIATHVPLVGSTTLVSAALFQTKIYPHSTYVLGAFADDGVPAPGLYADLSDPYYYLRVPEQRGGR